VATSPTTIVAPAPVERPPLPAELEPDELGCGRCGCDLDDDGFCERCGAVTIDGVVRSGLD